MTSNLITISIDDFKIKYVEFVYEANKLKIENIDEEYFDELLSFYDKEPKIIYLLDTALKEIFLRKKNIAKDVSLTIPSKYFYIAKLPYDNKLSTKELNNYFKWELPIIFPELNNQDIIVQNIKLDDVYSLAIGIKRSIINIIKKFVVNANLNLKLVENEHLAFNRFIKNYRKPLQSNYLALSIGNQNFTLSYNSPNNIIDFRTYSYTELNEIIEKTHVFYNENIKFNDLIINIYLSGNNISKTFVDILEETKNFIVKIVNPFEGIPIATKAINTKLYSTKYYSFFSNVALTLSSK